MEVPLLPQQAKGFAFFRRLAFPLRIFLLLLLISTVLVAALGQYLSASFEDYLTRHVRDMAMNQAKIIASNDSVVEGVKNRDSARLAAIAHKLADGSDFDYVVIGDRHSIRLYHPNPAKIGYPMQWTKPGAMEKGESYFITGKGSIGMAMRAKTPVFDEHGQVIGVVSLGYLVSKIDSWRLDFLLPMAGVFVLILIILLLLSWLFAAHIRRQMMGMEPRQIARVVRQQEALFGSVFEGLIAVDPEGHITAINRNARRMLGLASPGRQWLGQPICDVVQPCSFFTDKIAEKRQDVICTFNGLSVIANRGAIRSGNEMLGAIISFRSKDEISTLNAQLTQIKQYVESLRALRHEHLNWMSTLSGLLQMKEYDRVLEMVKGESQAQQELIDSLRASFDDRQVAGLLFGKVQRARELGLSLKIVEGSQLQQLPAGLDSTEFAAIVGNLLDNAFEASLRNPQGDNIIELYLSDEGPEVIIEVGDHGCGVPVGLGDAIFDQGVSTKRDEASEHGIGLYLISSYVGRCGGVITLEDNAPCGALFSVFIPKVKLTDATASHDFDS
ncbi:sensor histidine kinase DpiB [Scandinavium lactucae]|uniref:histidine kinase n=1 Tax=Scandinavium lactucae TaxID=3095028 RepID=A0ABU4QVX7_9ENTR|nr:MULTISPECIES: sensor histidine kinase DpiB [unclassified Scandinavium]MDX6042489.1 sensor histidine kinase DpiB [Scandinavium sp. V105_6]MDX6052490.1 sensor histidine kinase DpiB [Scandinavium sp. V105_1]